VADSRLYLYRKAGRSVWDAEFHLPDGRRRTWRTGLTDRDQAEHAARERLERMTEVAAATDAQPKAAAVPIPPPAPSPGNADSAPTSPRLYAQDDPGRSQRLDRWFFRELARCLVSERE